MTTPETLPEKWLTLPRAMRVWHAVALDPVRLLTLDVDHARQVLEAQANEVALIVERLQSSEQRLAEAEKRHGRLAAYIVLLEDAWMLAAGVTSEDRRAARELNRARQGVDFDLGRPGDAALAHDKEKP